MDAWESDQAKATPTRAGSLGRHYMRAWTSSCIAYTSTERLCGDTGRDCLIGTITKRDSSDRPVATIQGRGPQSSRRIAQRVPALRSPLLLRCQRRGACTLGTARPGPATLRPALGRYPPPQVPLRTLFFVLRARTFLELCFAVSCAVPCASHAPEFAAMTRRAALEW